MGPELRRSLEHAQAVGFLGEGSLDQHLAHAVGFASVVEAVLGRAPGGFVDLGSGGGIPGLVLAALWPQTRMILLDAHARRVRALREAVADCGWESRAQVLLARAEDAGRDLRWRASQELVVARGFGAPAVLAECAAPLLRGGGILVVSEPPLAAGVTGGRAVTGHPRRWPAEPLCELGLQPEEFLAEPFAYQVLRQVELCPDRFPRRSGVPAKRPLYRVER